MPSKHDLQPLLDVQQNQLNLVFSDSNGIDAKALAMLGANVAALLFVDDKLTLNFWHFVFGYLPFLMSVALNVVAIWPRKYLGASADITTEPEYVKFDKEALVANLLSDTIIAIKYNTHVNRSRMLLCNLSILLTVLGFSSLLVIL